MRPAPETRSSVQPSGIPRRVETIARSVCIDCLGDAREPAMLPHNCNIPETQPQPPCALVEARRTGIDRPDVSHERPKPSEPARGASVPVSHLDAACGGRYGDERFEVGPRGCIAHGRRARGDLRPRRPTRKCSGRRRHVAGHRGNLSGAALPALVHRVQQDAPRGSDQLPGARQRRRRQAVPGRPGQLRRQRRGHDRRGDRGGQGRRRPAADDGRQHRAGLQPPGWSGGAEAVARGVRRHLPRQDHQLERPEDRERQSRRHACRT